MSSLFDDDAAIQSSEFSPSQLREAAAALNLSIGDFCIRLGIVPPFQQQPHEKISHAPAITYNGFDGINQTSALRDHNSSHWIQECDDTLTAGLQQPSLASNYLSHTTVGVSTLSFGNGYQEGDIFSSVPQQIGSGRIEAIKGYQEERNRTSELVHYSAATNNDFHSLPGKGYEMIQFGRNTLWSVEDYEAVNSSTPVPLSRDNISPQHAPSQPSVVDHVLGARSLHAPSNVSPKNSSGSLKSHNSPVNYTSHSSEGAEVYSEMARRHGPCSKNWEIAPRTRRRKKDRAKTDRRRGDKRSGVTTVRRRGAFKDDSKRETTALTRKLKGCIRCRFQRIRCDPDPENLKGTCLTCQRISGPTIINIPCIRTIITDASIYREQVAPYQLFSKRWQTMDLVDINTWASPDTKTIQLSQIFVDAPYQIEVKEFIPIEGDMLEDRWTSGGLTKTHSIPRYAIANMKNAAQTLQNLIDSKIAKYIIATLGRKDEPMPQDDLLYTTYIAAFRQMSDAKTLKERFLLLNCFRVWMACRKTSNPEHICGPETLGGEVVDDPESPFFNRIPIPVIMIAQMECIMYTKILRPMSKKVLDDLHNLVMANKRENWFTIYLAIFVLMHSCSMITKRDEETARQYGLEDQFANPVSIQGFHNGAQTMLGHFHYVNKGAHPFSLATDLSKAEKFMEDACLNAGQTALIRETALWLEKRAPMLLNIRQTKSFGHDFYWISQLYDSEWVPGPTA